MARTPAKKFNESELTKGQLRKLKALRNSLGEEIADKAFAEWYEQQGAAKPTVEDKNARRIADALQPLIDKNQLRIPRGGYMLRRGRGRVIVETHES